MCQIGQNGSWPCTIRVGLEPPDVMGLSLPEIGATVIEAVAEHLERSPHVRRYLELMPKGKGSYSDCPNDPIDELVSHVARMAGAKGIDKSDPMVNLGWMTKIMSPVFQLERQVMKERIDSEVAAGRLTLERHDQVLLRYGFTLAAQVDALFLALFRKLVVPYQQMDESDRKAFAAHAATQLPEYDYTTYDIGWDNGQYEINRRQSWALAFPDETRAICITLAKMLDDLPEGEPLWEYFSCLMLAYACEEIDGLEKRWKAVDEAWVKLGSDLLIIPVHGIETYNLPRGVQPEFRLEFRTDASREEIGLAKFATTKAAENLGLSPAMIRRIGTRLNNTDIGVFVTGAKAGFNLNFPMAGQSAPNRQEVQETGARIFIIPSREETAVKIYRQLAAQCCDPDTAIGICDRLTTHEMRDHTIYHECAHPLGRTAAIDAALGEMGSELEEAKASLVGMIAAETINSSPEARQARVACVTARFCRFFQENMLTNASVAPYVRENKVAAITLMDAGVLTLTDAGICIDWELAGTDVWAHQLRLFGVAVTQAYASQDPEAVRQVARDYYDHDHLRLQALIDWCRREVPELAAA